MDPQPTVPAIAPSTQTPAVKKPSGMQFIGDVLKNEPGKLRDFDDFDSHRQHIFDYAADAVKTRFPVANERYTLSLTDIGYEDIKPIALKEQKHALLNNMTLTKKLQGKWVLTDNASGQVVDKSSKRTLMNIPYLTNRGTFIRNGTEYALINQFRLIPGVFSKWTDDGRIESHINVKQGTGNTFKISMDPASAEFTILAKGRKIRLYPVLKALDVPDSMLEEVWGKEILDRNRKGSPTQAVRSAMQSLTPSYRKLNKTAAEKPELDPAELADFKGALMKSELDPEATQTTLGSRHSFVSPALFVDVTKKLIGISKKEQVGDDRDSLEFQRVYSAPHFIAEKILKDPGNIIKNSLWKVTNKGNLSALGSGTFNKHMDSLFNTSGLGMAVEEINPFDTLDQAYRVTRMGEGGIRDENSIPEEARAVQPTYRGYVDPIRSPESSHIGVDLRLTHNTKVGEDGILYREMFNPRTQKTELVNSTVAARKIVGFPESMKAKGNFAPAMVRGEGLKYVNKKDIDYVIPHGSDLFSLGSNLVPLNSGIKGMRLLMGGKMVSQALPLVHREAPLVRSSMGSGKDFYEGVAKFMGAKKSDKDGVVKSASKDHIAVANADGTESSYELYNNFPYARKTSITNSSLVKPGQKVRKGELLASSNFTSGTGETALGTNLRVAYTPYRGHSFEDGIVLSESASKKLTSEHTYATKLRDEEGQEVGKTNYVSIFPGKFTQAQYDNMSPEGVIKPGTVVQPKDPLILATRTAGASVRTLGRRTTKDVSEIWDYPEPGVVTDVTKNKDGWHVYVRANSPAKEADKLSGRFGNKGVISHIIPDNQMPHDKDGKPFDMLINPVGVVSRCYDKETEFLTNRGWVLGKDILEEDLIMSYSTETDTLEYSRQLEPIYITDYCGDMYMAKSKAANFCVTPGHTMYVKSNAPQCKWRIAKVEDIYGKKDIRLPQARNIIDGDLRYFILPQIEYSKKDTQSNRGEISIDVNDMAAFMGWYLSEGNANVYPLAREYTVCIAQNKVANPEKWEEINYLLKRLPFGYHWNSANNQFIIHSKRLATYCSQFGKCHQKYIPEWLFSCSYYTRYIFLDALWKGDGALTRTINGVRALYSTCSSILAGDVQRMLLFQGESSTISISKADARYENKGRYMHHVGRRMIKSKDVCILKNNWSKIHYEDKVYCPTVKTGFVVTRREGKLLIAGNTNPAQLIEAALGKIAAKTGKPYVLPGFTDDPEASLADYAQAELKKNNMEDTEDLYDPLSGKKIPKVFTGVTHFYKLQHTAEAKSGSRSFGGYSLENQPSVGGSEGAKRIGNMEVAALISHGASETLKDMKMIKGQKNDNYWRDLKLGKTPVMPKDSFIFNKFLASLQAAGINVDQDRNKINLFAMNNEQLKELSGAREIRTADTYDPKHFKPIPGGLFDENLTGGSAGNKFSYIKLDEPLLNPIMEDSVRRMLGLKEVELEDLISGKTPYKEKYGGEALKQKLVDLNVNQEIVRAVHDIKSSDGVKRDNAVKRLRALKSIDEHKMRPEDFMMDRIPVIPPQYRPVSASEDMTLASDFNYLYREILFNRDDFKEAKDKLSDDMLSDIRGNMYKNFKALVGLGDPVNSELKQKGIGGILEHIFGKNSAKSGQFQRRMLGGSVDLSARAAITPNPNLKLNQVGLPQSVAWELYEPFIIRYLVRHGTAAVDAAKAVVDRRSDAEKALEEVMKERPVLINRAPTMHKWGIMAAHPILVKGHTLQIPTAVCGPFGADFDGDTMSIHVPVSDEATREAREKMMPEHSLVGAKNHELMYAPSNEYVQGAYIATKAPKKGLPLTFETEEEAIQAYKSGKIDVDSPIKIRHRKMQ
jgi:DNA-directed RNA polymerase beta subunit